MVIYLNQPSIIPFYFTYQGKVLLDESLSGYVKIFKVSPSFSEINQNFPPLIFSEDYNAYVFNYNFPSSIFNEGTYLIKAFISIPNQTLLISQKIINLKNISTDLSLFDLFEISKFIYSEDLEDIDVDRLILVFEMVLNYVEGYIGRNLIPKVFEETFLVTPQIQNNLFLILKNYPLLEVIECKYLEDNTNIKFDILDLNSSKILLKEIPTLNKYIKIKYRAGEYPVPQGLLSIIYNLTGLVYERVKYMNFDRISTLGLTHSLNKDILSDFEKMLNKYKRIV